MKFIDVHVYAGKWGFPIKNFNCKEILSIMDEMEIEKAILMSALGINYDFITGNAELMKEIDKYDRLFGYIYVNGNYPELSIKEMEKYLDDEKFVGIKIQPEYSGIPLNSPEFDPIWQFAEKYNKPVLAHTWSLPEHNNLVPNSLPEFAVEVAQKHSKLKLILGHMGGMGWRECLRVSKNIPNVWLDFCCSFMDKDKIKAAVEVMGAEKILFGTAMTENNGWTQIGALTESDISEEDKEKIAYKNALELFQF